MKKDTRNKQERQEKQDTTGYIQTQAKQQVHKKDDNTSSNPPTKGPIKSKKSFKKMLGIGGMVILLGGVMLYLVNQPDTSETAALEVTLELAKDSIQIGEILLLEEQLEPPYTERDITGKEYFSLDETVVGINQQGEIIGIGTGETTVGVIITTDTQKVMKEVVVQVIEDIDSEVGQEENRDESGKETIGEENGEAVGGEQDIADEEKQDKIVEVGEGVKEAPEQVVEATKEESTGESANNTENQVEVATPPTTDNTEKEENKTQVQYTGYSPVEYNKNINTLGFYVKSIGEKESGDMIEFLMEYEQEHNVEMNVDCYKGMPGPSGKGYGNTVPYSTSDWYLYVEDGKNHTTFKIPKKALEESGDIALWFAKGAVSESVYIPQSEITRILSKYKASSDGTEHKQVAFTQEKNELQNIVLHEIKSKDFGEMVEICLKLTTPGWIKANVSNGSTVANKVVENPLNEEWVSLYVNKKSLKSSGSTMLDINIGEWEKGRNIYFIDVLNK